MGSELIGWQSTAEFDLATMTSTAFLAATTPVSWARQILMLKRRFVIVVDRLQSDATHEYRWLFHYAPTTLRTDVRRKRLLTGFDDRNLLLAPFQPETFQQMKAGQGHMNRNGRNIVAPMSDFVAQAADFVAAFLLLPVSGTGFPDVRLQQTSDAGGVTFEVHTPDTSVRLFVPRASSDAGTNRTETKTTSVTVTPIKRSVSTTV